MPTMKSDWRERVIEALRSIGVEESIPAILEVFSQEKTKLIEEVNKLQKQCVESDGLIDGVTALHEVINLLKENENT